MVCIQICLLLGSWYDNGHSHLLREIEQYQSVISIIMHGEQYYVYTINMQS